jgi:hypothetical protein
MEFHGKWLVLLISAGMTLGCESSGRQGIKDDPLLVSKKPIEGQSAHSPSPLLAFTEPAIPTPPDTAYASAPKQKIDSSPAPSPVIGVPAQGSLATQTHIPKAAPPATPVNLARTKRPIPVMLAAERKVPGTFGRAPDYSWLQGLLEKHYDGHWELRYAPAGVNDPWQGKVRLEDDPRLAAVKEQDVVLVEGDLLLEQEEYVSSQTTPRFQIRQLWVLPPAK